MASSLKVGLVGLGNIGTGVMRALNQNKSLLEGRLDCPIQITRIVDKDVTTPRDADYNPDLLSTDADALLADPQVAVVIELTGTVDFARNLVDAALCAGKHVVTANKALIATCGPDLLRTAQGHNVCLLFEAAVGGGIPLIRTLQRGLAANTITTVAGIINGTANYILTRMTEDGLAFEDALAEAQQLGYAEPDPTFDVEGIDTAHKLAILAMLCFGQDIRLPDVSVEGITAVTATDISLAREAGYAIKLLGIARCDENGTAEARVHPALVPAGTGLGAVGGVLNAVYMDGNLTGPILLVGAGAGPAPTAGAILSDLIALAGHVDADAARQEMRLGLDLSPSRVRPMADIESSHCIRLGLANEANGLSRVAAAFEAQGVALASIADAPDSTPDERVLVAWTRRSREAKVRAALEHIRVSGLGRNVHTMRVADLA
jgi:homoserine dehydrogenase